jgi:hypothetical protein
MARVTHGPLISDAKGSVGVVNFAHYFGTPYVRQTQRPYVSNTPAQQSERELFASIARLWPQLSGIANYIMRARSYEQGKYPHAYFNSAALRALKYGGEPSYWPRAFGSPPLDNPRLEAIPGFLQFRAGPYSAFNPADLVILSFDTFGNVNNLTSSGDFTAGIDVTTAPIPGQFTPPYLALAFIGRLNTFNDITSGFAEQSAGVCVTLP